MLMKMFSVYDRVAERYSPIYCMITAGEAEREFMQKSADTNTAVGRSPEDYELTLLGELDMSTGEIQSQKPVIIARGRKAQ